MNEPRIAAPVIVLVEQTPRTGQFLLEWHDKWRTFMFPASMPRTCQDDDWGINATESAGEAAVRATAEATGVCLRVSALQKLSGNVSVTAVSGSQGSLTSYQPEVFRYRFSEDTSLQSPRPTQWLSLEDVADVNIGPISNVAREIARNLLSQAFQSGATPNDLWEPVQ